MTHSLDSTDSLRPSIILRCAFCIGIAAAILLAVSTSISGSRELDSANHSAPAGSATMFLTEQQFEQIFSERHPSLSYQTFVESLALFPTVFQTGNQISQRQELAAFLAHVHHETGGLKFTRESNEANWSGYCDPAHPCAAGQLYYGRGPLQLSWNYNYNSAGNALGIDLLNDPDLVARDPAAGWATALWFWTTQTGAGTFTPHEAMVRSAGFAETVRAINGNLECDKPSGDVGHAQMLHRAELYEKLAGLLGVPAGTNVRC